MPTLLPLYYLSPMLVVQVLSNERVRLHSTIGIHLWHVHVVYEIDEFLGARGTKVSTWEHTTHISLSLLVKSPFVSIHIHQST